MKNLCIHLTLISVLCAVLAACAPQPPASFDVPTLASLPTETDTSTPTSTAVASQTFATADAALLVPSSTDTATLSPSPLFTFTLPPTATDTASPTATLTLTPTLTYTATLTPSLTITKTMTPTITNTPTRSPEPGLASLAVLAAQVTIVPPAPPTQTAMALAAEQLRQMTLSAGFGMTPTPVGDSVGAPVVVLSTSSPVVILATLPPALCTAPPPGGLAGMLEGDPAFAPAMGCASGMLAPITAAYQPFERGAMIYVQGAPGLIYVLTNDGRLRRFNDTWVSGVDPESAGLTPPPNLIEPIRGFGKIWRENMDVQAALGWATAGEGGMTATMQLFDRGRALFLPLTNQTYLLAEDVPFTGGGSWRVFAGGF